MGADSVTPAASSAGTGKAGLPSGIWALGRVAAFHQRPVDPDQILRALGLERREIGASEIQLASAELHLKSRDVQFGWARVLEAQAPIRRSPQGREFRPFTPLLSHLTEQ